MNGPRWRIQRLQQTASTNDDMRRAAEADEAPGLVIVANSQSAGRGRQGRLWESPPGNLYCSALLRPVTLQQVAGLYSFVAALAVHDTVAAALPRVKVTLKWPNDVLANRKKISGVLLEIAGDNLIVGIGINVAHFPDNALYPTTSIAAEGGAQDLSQTLDVLLDRFAYWDNVMETEGFAPIRAAWIKHAQQGDLTVRLAHETFQGGFAGVDETGHLRLRLADGAERAISAGDVLFVPSKD